MGAVALGATALGAGLSAYGQYQAGQAQGKINDRNAFLARRAAIDAVGRGASEASRAVMRGSQVAGAAVGSAEGIDVNSSGSLMSVIETTKAFSAMDAETIKNNALREALGYQAQADSFKLQGQLDRNAGTYGAIGTLLGGAGSASQIYYSSANTPKLSKGG